MCFVNCYDTPNGPHYSRPHETLGAAVRARDWFTAWTRDEAKCFPPARFAGSLRVTLKDPALARYLQGGPTLFTSPARKGKAKKPPAPRPEPPVGYVNATALCNAAGRPWSRYWETRAAVRCAGLIARDLGTTVPDLIRTVRGGDAKRQGTFVHPRVAWHLRQWLGLDVEGRADAA